MEREMERESEVRPGKLSSLQFTNPRVTMWKFSLNRDFDLQQYDGHISNGYRSQVDRRPETEAKVSLEMIVGEEGAKAPFFIQARIEADFRWKPEGEGDIDKLLKQNGVVLLLSYLRPMISQFTTYAGLPPFMLPFIDAREV